MIDDLNPLTRRDFIKLIGASAALAGLPACTRQSVDKIVPYVTDPEQLVPGKPLYFATAMTLGGFATGLLVESHEGHPTKIEGNPDHAASLGATNIFHQAALLDLYDPDRSQAVLHHGQPSTWEEFVSSAQQVLASQSAGQGRGLAILTETSTSPTLQFQLQRLQQRFPEAKWHQWEPLNRDNCREGAKLAFGEIVETHFHFDKARVIVALESDFLFSHPNSVRYARDFATLRRARLPEEEMSRLYAVEGAPSLTGANADHRLSLRSSDVPAFVHELAGQLGLIPQTASRAAHASFISALVQDLSQHRGESIIAVGDSQPAPVHALAHALNHFLGNVGNTITFTPSAEADPVNQTASLGDLANALRGGQVEALVILGGNPAFTAPADYEFAKHLAAAKFKVHLSPDLNETTMLCDWHIPQNHFLESWSDARAFDGTVSIIQPLILPLYAGKSSHEVLDAMLSPPGRSDYEIIRDFWSQQNASDDFEHRWRRALHDGLIAGTALPQKTVSLRAPEAFTAAQPPQSTPQGELEISFRPDATIWDGRFANNGWLQELPKPITKMVWDNAVLISPTLAATHDLSNGDLVQIALSDRQMTMPVWVTPGQAEHSITLPLGYGRSQVGHTGQNTGFNVFPLRGSTALWFAMGATLKNAGGHYPLVTSQTQHLIDSEERQIFREGTLAEFKADPQFVREHSEAPAQSDTLFDAKEFAYDGYRWGMVIDLSACIGCAACTIACQAENNIPVVGKRQVDAGRIMHWIRVDHYFREEGGNLQMTHQPVPCMHCENAPCEVVCPVGATLHDKEGLNLQVYQRCIGTRYCSNNCPYKVRRFNFLEYADYRTPSLKPMWNPNVTVRWRGVMEKCTYCIQRISAARITAANENRNIREGEFQTACQQVCPANAIIFGNLGAADSRVATLKTHPLNFAMLGQLNTRPRTTYLAKLRNPNLDFPA